MIELYRRWVSMTIKVCWRVTQQGTDPIMTVNLIAPFTGTADLYIPMKGVGTGVILEASIPIFIMASVDRMFTELSLSISIL